MRWNKINAEEKETPVNKNELVDFIAEKSKSDLSKALITEIIELAFQGIEQELKKGGEARLSASAPSSWRAARPTTGRNPRTGESIKIDRLQPREIHRGQRAEAGGQRISQTVSSRKQPYLTDTAVLFGEALTLQPVAEYL